MTSPRPCIVNSQETDPDGAILECLLVFDDIVRATKLHMPDRYQGLLTEFGRSPDRARFSQENLQQSATA